jgi:hypothetical protein
MKKPMRCADGLYHIKGKTYKVLRGSRAQVWNGTAYKTEGSLLKGDLVKSHGRIVSALKHKTAKKEMRLQKYGFFAKKGKFGYVKKSASRKSRKSRRKTARRRRRVKGGEGSVEEEEEEAAEEADEAEQAAEEAAKDAAEEAENDP